MGDEARVGRAGAEAADPCGCERHVHADHAILGQVQSCPGPESVDADDKLAGLTSDPDDLHVCALTIASNADYLFTADRGYLRDKLASMGVTTMHPDQFLTQLLDREPSAVLDTLEAQAWAWAGGRSITELIDALERANATQFAAAARRALDA